MKKLVFWAIATMVLVVGVNHAALLMGASSEDAAAVAFVVAFCFALAASALAAFAVAPMGTSSPKAALAALAALAASLVVVGVVDGDIDFAYAVVSVAAFTACAAIFGYLDSKSSKARHWQELSVLALEAVGIVAGLHVWSWTLFAAGGIFFLGRLFREMEMSAYPS